MVRPRKESLRPVVERNDLIVENRGLLGFCLSRNSEAVRVIGEEAAGDIALDVLIRCAELYNPARGTQFSTIVVLSIGRRLRQEARRSRRRSRRRWEAARVVRAAELGDFDRLAETYQTDRDGAADGERRSLCVRLLACLYPRERRIVVDYVVNGRSFSVIAKEHGICRERVRQIYREALARMRLRAGDGDGGCAVLA